VKLKIKLTLDEYLDFLDQYFALFDFKNYKHKIIKGKNFKL